MKDNCLTCNAEFENTSAMSGWCRECIGKLRTPQTAGSILIEADKLVNGERQEMYADPILNIERIADIASAITGRVLSPADCCLVLVATKLAREIHKHTRDNITDCAGYLEIYNRIVEAKDSK